ncbi:MAG: hypothetical protein H6710_02305 [Myxococcales bacterium]|nr:hypothetical protein [Myxococcales bacterium]MCB9703904.1 hypothetical protein [Myxococcales bacterium]
MPDDTADRAPAETDESSATPTETTVEEGKKPKMVVAVATIDPLAKAGDKD